MSKKTLYKVTFLNHGKVYELYAQRVASGALWGFTEVAELVFDLREGVVVDPTACSTCRCRASSESRKWRRRANRRFAMRPRAKPWSRRSRCRPSRAKDGAGRKYHCRHSGLRT
jgi:hypothetical protein